MYYDNIYIVGTLEVAFVERSIIIFCPYPERSLLGGFNNNMKPISCVYHVINLTIIKLIVSCDNF